MRRYRPPFPRYYPELEAYRQRIAFSALFRAEHVALMIVALFAINWALPHALQPLGEIGSTAVIVSLNLAITVVNAVLLKPPRPPGR